MLGTVVVYLGLGTALLGAVSLLWPVRFLLIRSRGRGTAVLMAGIVLIVAGAWLPTQETRVITPRTQLDEFVPVYQFSEYHTARVVGSREQVYRALKSVTADDILWFRTLTWIRRFGRSSGPSILNPPAGEPLLSVAARTSFILLSEEPNREIVLGSLVAAPRGWRPASEPTPAKFKALHAPGFAVAGMNFRLEDDGPGATRITTETRVYATDATTCRRLAAYWRVIYPGSALLRRTWLRAIVRRTESARNAP